ncbi:hypothetical protein EDC96DRAFT_492367 [Choanephora cucurbitarum]|nr:hypothetical protein EDC96DRAFT_492367 [Choanephora cucurbitarum]
MRGSSVCTSFHLPFPVLYLIYFFYRKLITKKVCRNMLFYFNFVILDEFTCMFVGA